jgi:hypothetical protein
MSEKKFKLSFPSFPSKKFLNTTQTVTPLNMQLILTLALATLAVAAPQFGGAPGASPKAGGAPKFPGAGN